MNFSFTKIDHYSLLKCTVVPLTVLLMLISNSSFAQASGKIAGKVIEATSGTPLIGANIVILNTTWGTAADKQGNYTIARVEPGNYQIKASFLGYQEKIIDVTVRANETVTVKFELQETLTELGSVVVYGELTRGQAKSLNEQKNSANIKNVVSSEQFQLFPDRNAAETAARIPGVSISYDQGEGEVITIRGIGPEFNSLTVNGQRIPAPDPDLGRAVGLDLLNQDLMENIVVTKALTPDMDGDAIGGNVNFQMKQAPDAGILAVNLGGGYNVQHSEFDKYGKDIIDVSTYGGQRFFDNKLGILAAGSYYKTNRGSMLRQLEYTDPTSSQIIFAQHSNDYDVLRERWGVNVNTEYKFNEFNKVYLNLNHNRYFDKEIRRLVDWNIDDEIETKETRNRVEDQFLSGAMLGGNHNFDGIKLDYTASWIETQEDMPARTYFRFQRDFDFSSFTNDDVKNFGVTSKFSGQDTLKLNRIRVDDNQKDDKDISGMANIEIPYQLFDLTNSLKFGGKYLTKKAKFTARRLQLRNFPKVQVIGEGEFGFQDVVVGPDQTKYLGATRVEYLDQSSNNYDASEAIIAAYGMTTINFSQNLSMLVGLRFENTTNKYKTLAITSVNKAESKTSYSNILPSAHLTYRFNENMNLRFAYSTGISRPNYESLTPYEFRDDDAREISKGNPDLEPAKSHNFDLMFENYSSYLGLFSAGVYYKKMSNIVVSSQTLQTLPFEGSTQQYEVTIPINGDEDAKIYGVELAVNQRLNFLGISFLDHFTIYTNYTYTKSEFKVGGRTVPLGFSPENIVNLALMYDNPDIGLSFMISNNFRDDILIAVGNDKFTDVFYKKEYHLDISITQKILSNLSLFLQLNNLTDQAENEAFGDPSESYSKWTQWAKFNSYGTLGISYKL